MPPGPHGTYGREEAFKEVRESHHSTGDTDIVAAGQRLHVSQGPVRRAGTRPVPHLPEDQTCTGPDQAHKNHIERDAALLVLAVAATRAGQDCATSHCRVDGVLLGVCLRMRLLTGD